MVGEAQGHQPCPGCGAMVDSQYCPHCGARTTLERPVLSPAPRPVQNTEPPTVPSRAVPTADGPPRAAPEMFPTDFMPISGGSHAWSQAPDQVPAPPVGPSAGLFPGWTGVYPAVATKGGVGVLAPRAERRRNALYAMVGIAALTAVVLLTALLIAPHWGGTAAVSDKNGQPVVASSIPDTGTGSATVPAPPAPTPPTTTPGPTTTAGQSGTSTAAGPTPIRTVTVTATPTRAAVVGTGPGKPTPGKPTVVKPTAGTLVKPTVAKPTVKPTPVKPTPVLPLGVPQRNIACNAGYIVQLASEFDSATFAARVATLRKAGRLPAGALAADASKSCRIFTNQRNTYVLYAGPFPTRYAGCAVRLAGPADAYVKGSDTANSREYVSCLCPAKIAAMPQYSTVGQHGVWVGELQRILGNRLNIDVGDLTGQWGVFTAGTQAAVRTFQLQAGLWPSGILYPGTWQALQKAQC